MILKPVLTEKSLDNAKKGQYSFWMDKGLNKRQIKNLIQKIFAVHVVEVKTMNYKREEKKNYKGRKQVVKPAKKVLVSLKSGEKIALFEEKGK